MDLINLKTKQDLKRIIVEILGYPAIEERPFPLSLDEKLIERIELSTIIASLNGFNVVYIQIKTDGVSHNKFDLYLRGTERLIINKIDKHSRQQYLFVFSTKEGKYWHFVNAQANGNKTELRRFSITPYNRNKLRTAISRLLLLKVETNDDLQSIIDKNKKAFDVEEVTMEFFRIFAGKFLELIEILKQARHKEFSYDKKATRDVAQIILNRLVFLKFIEQKSWLDGNTDYLYKKFQSYYSGNNSYWIEIITPLFELLSNPNRNNDNELGQIPFLNGGLFGSEPKDLFLVDVPNSFFEDLFDNLLNRFNFTIEESAPNSVEVAVDPEMLGRIFEELVLRLEKTAEKSDVEVGRELRRETGSYYTPRVAVFFMCREAISQNLTTEADIPIEKVKKIIDLSLDELPDIEQIDAVDLTISEAQGLLRAVEKITICDPAVGSGAFLLGALQMLTGLRRFLILKIGDNQAKRINFDYSLKAEVIRDNLVGVDIMLQAVHICELRLWLSLAVDYQRDGDEQIPTLPNLTYKIFRGDSVLDNLYGTSFDYLETLRVGNIFSNADLNQDLTTLIDLKRNFYLVNNDSEKNNVKEKIEKKKLELAIKILKAENKTKSAVQGELIPGLVSSKQTQLNLETNTNRERNDFVNTLEILLKNKKYSEALKGDRLNFVWKIDLVEFFADHGQSGFDIVIGNPPYGLKNEVMEKGKNRYNLGSKDSYGVFIALAIKDLLKPNGVLSFITSDTWQTIKSHRDLRRALLDNTRVHNLVMMPSWLFGATVNTSILIATKTSRENLQVDWGKGTTEDNQRSTRENNEIIACDFTRAEEKTGELEEYLYSLDDPEYISTPKKASYHYQQGLIETNTNWPFFVGSPKLFALMNDTTCKTVEKEIGEKEMKTVKVRQIELNGKTIELIRFGDIAEIRQGLATGDNDSYLFQNLDARGSYRSVNDYLEFLLTEDDLKKISGDEGLRKKVTDKGFHKSKNELNFDEDLWFRGRYIVPYDKGGKSDTEAGWLPNYYVPTEYYIDWSHGAVKRMKTHRSERQGGIIASRFQNKDYYFIKGATWSDAGFYSPTIRFSGSGVFDVKGSRIISDILSPKTTVALLASKFLKHWIKNINNHTVSTQVDDFRELGIPIATQEDISRSVDSIVRNQKQNSRYDYMGNEQKEIDKLIYEMYGLNKDDIREVETWYARRYPKLARFCELY